MVVYPKAEAKKSSQMQPNLHLKLEMSQKKHPDRNMMNVLSSAYEHTLLLFSLRWICTPCV